MLTVDARCSDSSCRNKDMYRMIGDCSNCRTEDVLMLFTAGHATRERACPVCGCESVRAKRLATPDEFPEAVTEASDG